MSVWLEVTCPAEKDTIDELAARLVAEGFDSFQIVDGRDLEEARPAWEIFDDELSGSTAFAVVLYLPAGSDVSRLRAICPELKICERREEEWADAWKRYYIPTPVGKRLLIQPAWLELDNPEGRAVYQNDPGMSFGTGLHASTRLCLEMLDAFNPCDKRVLDIGCGSGILGLCALVLGAKQAVGVDIDPLAADTAAQNAKLNGVSGAYTSLAGDFLNDGKLRECVGGGFDLIFSNIVADIIMQMPGFVKPFMAQHAVWAVSGIVEPRAEEVFSALKRCGFGVLETFYRDGWVAAKTALI